MLKKRKEFFSTILKSVILFGIDLFSYFISLLLALYVRKLLPTIFSNIRFPVFFPDAYFKWDSLVFIFIIFIVFMFNQLYFRRRTFWEELLIIWKSLFIASLFSYLFLFNFNYFLPFISRLVIFFSFAFMFVFLPLFRLLGKRLLLSLTFFRTPVMIVLEQGNFDDAVKTAKILNNNFYLGFYTVCFYTPDLSDKKEYPLPVYNNLSDTPIGISVFVVKDHFSFDSEIISNLYGKYYHIYIISHVGIKDSSAQYLFSERLFFVKLENQLNSFLSIFIKSLMDKVLGFLIILFFTPLLILVSIIVKLSSKGPVFFRHTRVGKGGKSFKILKFRTMHVDAEKKLQELLTSDPELKKEWDLYFKLKVDPRITPIGRFLRKYSLDELPQLFNVMLGDMSLVGPRPFVRGEIEEINPSLVPIFVRVKPGLTGLWQVSGRNNNDRMERIKIDIWYIQNWTPSLDIVILLHTPWIVFKASGAS